MSCDVFVRREIPFGDCNEAAPHLGGKIPPKSILVT